MWTCNCAKMLSNGDCGMKFYITEVTKDNICVKCEHYAMWVNSVDGFQGHQYMPVSVVNAYTKEIIHYGDVFSAAKDTKFKAFRIYTSKAFRAGRLFKPKNSQYMFIKGELEALPDGCIESIDKVMIYAYDMESNLVGSAYTKKDLSKITGDSVNSIYSNLTRTTVMTKRGIVYTHNKDFDGKDYAKISTKSSWDKV